MVIKLSHEDALMRVLKVVNSSPYPMTITFISINAKFSHNFTKKLLAELARTKKIRAERQITRIRYSRLQK